MTVNSIILKFLVLMCFFVTLSPSGIFNSFYAKHSYISSINIDKSIEIEFMNNAKVKPLNRTSGWRPIFINESDYMPEKTLGYALPTPLFCVVFISPDIKDRRLYKLVLLHEILHCYGYLHSPNPKDLMHKFLYDERQIKSLYWYLFDIDDNAK